MYVRPEFRGPREMQRRNARPFNASRAVYAHTHAHDACTHAFVSLRPVTCVTLTTILRKKEREVESREIDSARREITWRSVKTASPRAFANGRKVAARETGAIRLLVDSGLGNAGNATLIATTIIATPTAK